MDDEQREVVAFLRDPDSYIRAAPRRSRSSRRTPRWYFLPGTYAYKLKRAVKYAYLDFSTLALRLAACTTELRLNRRTAPSLYLEVRAISRAEDGRLRWGREGRPDDAVVDYVVVMRRFEQRDLLDNLARRGALSPPLLYALTAHIAKFHGEGRKASRSRRVRGHGRAGRDQYRDPSPVDGRPGSTRSRSTASKLRLSAKCRAPASCST